MSVSPKQLTLLLTKFMEKRLPLLITGKPGVGKSSIVEQACKDAGFDLIISHPAVSDPTDFKGLPWPDKSNQSASFIPFGEFNRALKATKKTAWFFDDLGQAPNAVQAACMQLFLARRVNGHVLPDCITFIGATNRRTDRAAVGGILEPVKSRFTSIVELEAELNSSCQWGMAHGWSATEIAFLRYRSELLSAFTPSADMTNSPMPRTWHNLSEIESLGLPIAIEAEAMAGAVGVEASTEYLAFRQMANTLVNLDAILLNPDKVAIPKTKPDQLYAIAVGLAARANVNNLGRIAVYCQRLLDAERGEFAALCIRDATRRDDKLQNTDTFQQIACGPVGALIAGEEVEVR